MSWIILIENVINDITTIHIALYVKVVNTKLGYIRNKRKKPHERRNQYEIERDFSFDISEGFFEDNALEIEMKELYSEAYKLAIKVHANQKRDDGSPYMTHIDGIIDILENEFNGSLGVTVL